MQYQYRCQKCPRLLTINQVVFQYSCASHEWYMLLCDTCGTVSSRGVKEMAGSTKKGWCCPQKGNSLLRCVPGHAVTPVRQIVEEQAQEVLPMANSQSNHSNSQQSFHSNSQQPSHSNSQQSQSVQEGGDGAGVSGTSLLRALGNTSGLSWPSFGSPGVKRT